MKVTIALALATAASANFDTYANAAPAFNRALSEFVNSKNTTWVASLEPAPIFAARSHGEAKKLMGTRRDGPKLPRKTFPAGLKVPASFDARTQWPGCPTIGEIRDQSACGSCWAFGAAEAISDRYCTYFGATNPSARQVRVAAGNLMSCCDSCGNGCDGGYPEAAWQYWIDSGLVDNTCEPYPFPSCAHHTSSPIYPNCSSSIYPTPACPSACADGTSVSAAKTYFGASSFSLSGESDFQQELLTNGPIEVTMNVYQDFENYKGGVYQHVSGPLMGGHAVRLLGWGVDNGTPYWLVANSWNPSWGEKGFFRILRGTDESGIEDDGTAGAPKAL